MKFHSYGPCINAVKGLLWFSAGPLKTDYLCLETDALSIWIVLSIRLKTNLQAEIVCLHVMGNFLNLIFKAKKK